MARIRTIKPEFWSSPGVTQMGPWARLTFIAMWNWADDFGRGTYEPRELMGFVFPREDDMTVKEFRTHVGEIHRHVGVTFYTVDERPYFEIGTWNKHQKTDPRLKQSKYPAPSEGVLIDPVSMQVIESIEEPQKHVGEKHSHVDESHKHVGAGTGEQGNRGTGEQSLKDLSDSGESDEPVSEHEPAPKPKKTKRHEYSPEFEEFWKTYPLARGASKYETSQKFMTALKVADAQTIIEAARRFAHDPNRVDEYTPMPTTWLNKRRWDAGPLPSRNQQPQQSQQASTNTMDGWLGMPQEPHQPEITHDQNPFGANIIDHEEVYQ